jgi:hypothetical protein
MERRSLPNPKQETVGSNGTVIQSELIPEDFHNRINPLGELRWSELFESSDQFSSSLIHSSGRLTTPSGFSPSTKCQTLTSFAGSARFHPSSTFQEDFMIISCLRRICNFFDIHSRNDVSAVKAISCLNSVGCFSFVLKIARFHRFENRWFSISVEPDGGFGSLTDSGLLTFVMSDVGSEIEFADLVFVVLVRCRDEKEMICCLILPGHSFLHWKKQLTWVIQLR